MFLGNLFFSEHRQTSLQLHLFASLFQIEAETGKELPSSGTLPEYAQWPVPTPGAGSPMQAETQSVEPLLAASLGAH